MASRDQLSRLFPSTLTNLSGLRRRRHGCEVSPDVVTNAVKPEGRLVVIMFDWSIRFLDQALARRIATAAVDQLGPDDLAAVVFSSGFANAGSPQNFTADRALLLAAINRPIAPVMQNPPKGSRGTIRATTTT